MPYSRFFDDAISKLKEERCYRVFSDLEREARAFPRALWPDHLGEVVIWCSTTICMARHPQLISDDRRRGPAWAGAGGTYISGTNHPLVELEADGRPPRRAGARLTSGWISIAAISRRRPFARLPHPFG
jgi:5-aminolevulinate synthase